MADRRMFTKRIVDNDLFMDMPATTRLLYYDLGMRADDDGFVNNPKSIIRQTGATNDDLSLLIAKRFIIPFESGVIVITHWKMHNYIQKDRYKPTLYTVEKSMIFLDENNTYQVAKSKTDTKCIQSGNIGKDRLGKVNNIYRSPESDQESKKTILEQQKADFQTIYNIYPRKEGKAKAFEYYRQFIGKGRKINGEVYRLTNKQIWHAVIRFVEQKKESGCEHDFYPHFSTFMSKTIIDYLPEEELCK